ncbi:MAG: DUF6265 family protein [Planctomycetota bacterium]|nr:DUF6265 family protein [Planctomycetota bacterium]
MPNSLFAMVALAALVAGRTPPQTTPPTQVSSARAEPKDLVGTWLYCEDRSEKRPEEKQRPNQGARFIFRLESAALVLEAPRPTTPYSMRLTLDGTPEVIERNDTKDTHSGRFEDGALRMSIRIDAPGRGEKREITVSQCHFTPTTEGLLVRMQTQEPIQVESVCLYKRLEDIPVPTPTRADIASLAWLAGNWTGTRGTASLEERWSPPGGGAMLATARTIAKEKMVLFEFLRVVERDGGLVYVAQPNGKPPVEFVLTLAAEGRFVFENPHHDFPQRIVYERSGESGMLAQIGYMRGGTQRFEFRREGN